MCVNLKNVKTYSYIRKYAMNFGKMHNVDSIVIKYYV